MRGRPRLVGTPVARRDAPHERTARFAATGTRAARRRRACRPRDARRRHRDRLTTDPSRTPGTARKGTCVRRGLPTRFEKREKLRSEDRHDRGGVAISQQCPGSAVRFFPERAQEGLKQLERKSVFIIVNILHLIFPTRDNCVRHSGSARGTRRSHPGRDGGRRLPRSTGT